MFSKRSWSTIASPKKETKNGLPSDKIAKVNSLYSNNDISWKAPDLILRTVNSDGTKAKTTEQACYLTVSLKEAYHHFMTINPGMKVGLSKFCDLRPPNINIFDSTQHNADVCIYHENIHLLLAVLPKYTKLLESFQDFVDQVTCDPSFYDCSYRKCDNFIHLHYTFKTVLKQCENLVR